MGRLVRPTLIVTVLLTLMVPNITPSFAQTGSSGGQALTVVKTEGQGVNFRTSPGGAPVGSWPDGARMTEVGDSKQVNGRTWRNVRAPDGTTGWIASDYLSGSSGSAGTTLAAVQTSSGLTVGKTDGMKAVLRDAPGGAQITSYPEGSSMTLVSNDVKQAAGRDWRNVKGPDGKSGWMAALLLLGDSAPVTVANSPASQPSSGTAARTGSAAGNQSSSPFTLTADMRNRALAARSRAVPLAGRKPPTTGSTTAAATTPTPTPAKKKATATPTVSALP
jgi:SH3-like domain-containing protein